MKLSDGWLCSAPINCVRFSPSLFSARSPKPPNGSADIHRHGLGGAHRDAAFAVYGSSAAIVQVTTVPRCADAPPTGLWLSTNSFLTTPTAPRSDCRLCRRDEFRHEACRLDPCDAVGSVSPTTPGTVPRALLVTVMEKPPATALSILTAAWFATVNDCPAMSPVFVSRLRGGTLFCAFPSGSDGLDLVDDDAVVGNVDIKLVGLGTSFDHEVGDLRADLHGGDPSRRRRLDKARRMERIVGRMPGEQLERSKD